MNRWSIKNIGEVCELINGRAFKPNEWELQGDPIIRIQNLNDSSKPFNYYSKPLPEKFRVRKNDILFSWSGTPGTSFGCFRWNGPNGWLNQHIFNVKINPDLNPDFFVYQMNTKLDELIGKAHGGVGLQHVTKGMVEEVKLSIPPLPEQHRIVNLLNEADALRKLGNEADKKSEKLIPALFEEMFSNRSLKDTNSRLLTLNDILENIDSGWSPTCHDRSASHDEWGVLKLGAVTKCQYIEGENKALPNEFEPRPELEVLPEDILFTRKNTYDLVAACAYVFQTRRKLMLSDLIFRLRLKPDSAVNPIFLWCLLTMPQTRKRIQSLAGGSAGSMPNISKNRLLSFQVAIPSLSIQKEFASRVSEIRALESSQSSSRKNLDALFQSMVHRAFQGEL